MTDIREEYAQYLDLDRLDRGLTDTPDPASDEEIVAVCERLLAFYAAMKRDQPAQRDVFQPGGEWKTYHEDRADLYGSWTKGDAAATAAGLRDFWRNGYGPIVKQYATFDKLTTDAATRERFADAMAYDYMVWKNLFHADPAELAVPPVGNPWGYELDGVVVAPKALRYHVLASQIRDLTSDAKRPVVAEVGAGYCGMAYSLLRDGAAVAYVDFDLPETLMLGAYYLLRTLPAGEVLLYGEGDLDAAALGRYSALLMPNWMIEKLPEASADVFLNTFSLSEMPLPVIEEYLEHISRCCRGYFLHNNMDREGVYQYGCPRTPASQFPVDAGFKPVYRRYDLFQRRHFGRDGDYREFLYQKKAGA